MASRIYLLPAHVANKIAAGEVVERPASVVKELVENAIDAGASEIVVQISAGGRKLISVADNGFGMGRDDALLSLERHATSKIRDVDDIEKISTLGFRGEALAAIASVSRFRMVTCPRGEVEGTEITVNGGKIADVQSAGCPPGTTMEIRNLFFNVPARAKFLRTQQTELSHIRQTFLIMALAHPEIGMILNVDGREVYRLPEGSDIGTRIHDLFGPEYIKDLKAVQHDVGGISVRGYISVPPFSRGDRHEQYFFINGRASGAPVLNYAISEGYRTLLPGDRHPAVFLFLELSPEQVDVNVHPTKKEVRFRHSGDVRDAVIRALRDSLQTPMGKQDTPAIVSAADRPAGFAGIRSPASQLEMARLPAANFFRYPELPQGISGAMTGQNTGTISFPSPAASGTPAEKSDMPTSPWSWCRMLGQVGGLYVVLEVEDGIVLMDPHAAHERVRFDRFMSEVLKGHVAVQTLLLPETVELRPGDALRLRKNLDVLKGMGFGISEFGGDSFVVDAVPACLADASVTRLLPDICTDLDQAGSVGKGRWRQEAIAQAACKSAVKARDKLSQGEIEQLIGDLSRTEMPYTCPHGRPTLIFMSHRDLHKKFGRE